MKYSVSFEDQAAVSAKEGTLLSEFLDAENSPILFGCRTGICGTCICKVSDVKNGSISPADNDELEILEVYSDEPHTRLACQVALTADIKLSPVEII